MKVWLRYMMGVAKAIHLHHVITDEYWGTSKVDLFT